MTKQRLHRNEQRVDQMEARKKLARTAQQVELKFCQLDLARVVRRMDCYIFYSGFILASDMLIQPSALENLVYPGYIPWNEGKCLRVFWDKYSKNFRSIGSSLGSGEECFFIELRLL